MYNAGMHTLQRQHRGDEMHNCFSAQHLPVGLMPEIMNNFHSYAPLVSSICDNLAINLVLTACLKII